MGLVCYNSKKGTAMYKIDSCNVSFFTELSVSVSPWQCRTWRRSWTPSPWRSPLGMTPCRSAHTVEERDTGHLWGDATLCLEHHMMELFRKEGPSHWICYSEPIFNLFLPVLCNATYTKNSDSICMHTEHAIRTLSDPLSPYSNTPNTPWSNFTVP